MVHERKSHLLDHMEQIASKVESPVTSTLNNRTIGSGWRNIVIRICGITIDQQPVSERFYETFIEIKLLFRTMEPAQVNVSLILFQNGFSSAYFLFYFSLFFSVVTMIAFKFLVSTCMSKIWNIKPEYYHETDFLCVKGKLMLMHTRCQESTCH